MKSLLVQSLGLAALTLGLNISAADTVFSGPQPGESTTPFKVVELGSTNEGKERDPITENAGAPTALVFVHTIERSLVPLLRVIDQYGAERSGKIKTEVVFLFADRLEGEQRIKAATRSLRLRSRVGLSLDGAEGPGNYGLNKECMMTVIAAKDNKVTANFALVQPGIADAPKVIEALARVCGDTTPPSIADLSKQAPERGMRRDQAMTGEGRMAAADREKFPGAVPEDPKLNSLLRQTIRPTNDDSTVDRLIADMRAHIKGNEELTRQAIDGWVRVLHFGERYGTAHARKAGNQLLDELKKEQPAKPKVD